MKFLPNQYKKKGIKFLLVGFLLQIAFIKLVHADFINGGFEDPYIVDNTNTFNPITGWTLTGYIFNTNLSDDAPTSLAEVNLTITTSPGGLSDMVNGSTQTLFDWFLFGAIPTPTLLVPRAGNQSALVNLRSINEPFSISRVNDPATLISIPPGWTPYPREATSISQQITVQASDFDPNDHRAHVRFQMAPVLQYPLNAHTAAQRPFFAVQLNNLTTGRTNANPLFFQWRYADQAGVPWQRLTAEGTNNTPEVGYVSSNDVNYQYMDWQAYDIAPGNAFIHVGDVIELIILGSGCSQQAHDGHVYVDTVQTLIPQDLWVNVTGPANSIPCSNVTYTYTYTNNTGAIANNVQVIANLPQQQQTAVDDLSPPSTTFVSITTPTAGSPSPSCSGTSPIVCTIGTLQPGEQGTFQLTVNIPCAWSPATGPVNNGDYSISATGVSPLIGPLVQTNLADPPSVSNMVANTSGLPPVGALNEFYSGTFTCSNSSIPDATGDATDASCTITNLPPGLNVIGCTISPLNLPWTQPAEVPANQIVTCSVQGTPTTTGTITALVTADASNNINSTTNTALAPITVVGIETIPASINGLPVTSPAVLCCGRPIIFGPLPIPGPGSTNYVVTSQTGNVSCLLNQANGQVYLKLRGGSGSCTITATKNGITSAPFTVSTP